MDKVVPDSLHGWDRVEAALLALNEDYKQLGYNKHIKLPQLCSR